jgi:hypothetical protein
MGLCGALWADARVSALRTWVSAIGRLDVRVASTGSGVVARVFSEAPDGG